MNKNISVRMLSVLLLAGTLSLSGCAITDIVNIFNGLIGGSNVAISSEQNKNKKIIMRLSLGLGRNSGVITNGVYKLLLPEGARR